MNLSASITVTYNWEMGHRLPEHDGKCFNLHGHRYELELTILGQLQSSGPSNGMVADFSTIKSRMRHYIDTELDHKMLIHVSDPWLPALRALPGVVPVSYVPTVELIASQLFITFTSLLNTEFYVVSRLKLYETATSFVEV